MRRVIKYSIIVSVILLLIFVIGIGYDRIFGFWNYRLYWNVAKSSDYSIGLNIEPNEDSPNGNEGFQYFEDVNKYVLGGYIIGVDPFKDILLIGFGGDEYFVKISDETMYYKGINKKDSGSVTYRMTKREWENSLNLSDFVILVCENKVCSNVNIATSSYYEK